MPKGKIDLAQKAKEYAFLLLKYRMRSEKELAFRLKKKKFSAELIGQTVSFLKEKKFIDDNYFTKTWIAARLKKPFGLNRIAQELRQKGVDREIIAQQLAQVKNNYPQEKIALELALRQRDKLKEIDPQTAKRRIWGYLLRRGFTPEIASDIVKQL